MNTSKGSNKTEDILADVSDYSAHVYRCLQKRDLIAGVSRVTLLLLFLLTAVVVFAMYQYWFVIVSAILYFALKALTKKDEFLVEIVLDSLLAPDVLEPG